MTEVVEMLNSLSMPLKDLLISFSDSKILNSLSKVNLDLEDEKGFISLKVRPHSHKFF